VRANRPTPRSFNDVRESAVHFSVKFKCGIWAALTVPVNAASYSAAASSWNSAQSVSIGTLREIASAHFRPWSSLRLPESNSATRFPISASQAACTPSSTLPPRLEIKESANASCSSTDSDNAYSSSLETSGVICAMITSLRSFYRSTSGTLAPTFTPSQTPNTATPHPSQSAKPPQPQV
jgi:hypothetical protein